MQSGGGSKIARARADGAPKRASKTSSRQPVTGPSFTLNSIPGKTTAEKRRVSATPTGLAMRTVDMLLEVDFVCSSWPVSSGSSIVSLQFGLQRREPETRWRDCQNMRQI